MKITRTFNTHQRSPIWVSHYGAHLKRSLGGPPWWRYVNGLVIRWFGRSLIWFEFYRSFRGGPLFKDVRRKRPGRGRA